MYAQLCGLFLTENKKKILTHMHTVYMYIIIQHYGSVPR